MEGLPTTLGDEESGQVKLLGWWLLSDDTAAPGETVGVRLNRQALPELPDECHTLLHLHTPAIQRSWAFGNQGVLRPPTRVWDPQKYYIETMRLRLPEDIPPISYTLVVGMASSLGERLPFRPDDDETPEFENGQLVAPLRVPLPDGASN